MAIPPWKYTTLAPPRGSYPHLSYTTGSRHLITRQWIPGQKVDQFMIALIAQNLVNIAGKIRCFNNGMHIQPINPLGH